MAKPEAKAKAKAKARGKAGARAKGSLPQRMIAALRTRPIVARALAGGLLALSVVGAAAWLARGCGWDPRVPFERNAPEVDQAIRDLDAGKLESAEQALERYLDTGPCGGDAGLRVSSLVRTRPNGTFDLGLTLFRIGERYGQRFGEEEVDAGQADERIAEKRKLEVSCALAIVAAIARDPSVPIELRARAHYLAGNLNFLTAKYEDAVVEYDHALALIPGAQAEAGADAIGRDVAHNRAIALRRIEDKKDAGNDANDASDQPDSSEGPDASDGPDGSDGGGDGGGEGDGGDGKGDGGSQDGGSQDGGPPDRDAGVPASQDAGLLLGDDRMLDELEEAPTYQQQEAKAHAGARRGRQMEDK